MRERMGKLQGGVGILKVGAPSEREREIKKQRGEEAVAPPRAAAEEGVVPGARRLHRLPAGARRPGERLRGRGSRGQGRGPRRAGLDAGDAGPHRVDHPQRAPRTRALSWPLREAPPGHGYDVVQDKIVDMTEAGILDPLKVIRTALETGASTGVMALTTDALVLTAKRDPAINP